MVMTMVLAGEAGEVLSGASLGIRLGVVAVLVLANGFFVAAKHSVGAKRGRSGISVTQFGITISTLAIGWLGEPAFASLIALGLASIGIGASPVLVHSTAALAIAFLVLTFLHITLGQLAPKSVALARSEQVGRLLAAPLTLVGRMVAPVIWLIGGPAGAVLRLLGIRPFSHVRPAHTPEELRLLVEQTAEHGGLNSTDTAMLAGVFDFHEKKARDVMRPRTEIVALAIDASADEVWEVLRSERYSRYPVYKESLDDVTGVFLAKDLWLHDDDKPFVLAEHVRPTLYVPDNRPAERVLDDLRRTRFHMAVVLDEYGGTAGILTLEDLIEEVIGDINDEYDFATKHAVEANGVLELAGSLSLVDVRSDYELDIPDGDWSTLGGFVFGALGRVPKMGDRVRFSGGDLEVVAMEGRRVAAVRVLVAGDAAPAGDAAAAKPSESDRPRAFSDREVPL